MKFFYKQTTNLVIIWDLTEFLNLHSVIPLHTNVVFPPNVIDSWNLLDVDTQNQHSRLMFKKQIRSNISVLPPYFVLGTRKYNIFHCQLRNLASNLNQYKFLSHLSDGSECPCGDDVEDNFHYFCQSTFHLPKNVAVYSTERFSRLPKHWCTLKEITYPFFWW
jgi:hypothetical protein